MNIPAKNWGNSLIRCKGSRVVMWYRELHRPRLVSSISNSSQQVHVLARDCGGIVSFRSKSQFVDFLVIMSPRISSPVTAPCSTRLTHPCPHDDHVKSRSIREELRNRRKMPTRHFSPKQALIAGGGPRVRTRAGRGCRSHGLGSVSFAACWRVVGEGCVPAPLTLRMMERVWSSMNSTRHWVTPPREPMSPLACVSCIF